MKIQIKRVYEAIGAADGKRILVDRLWPRGLSKAQAQLDLWPKELTPSNALRQWYHEDIEQRWDEFQRGAIRRNWLNSRMRCSSCAIWRGRKKSPC